MIRDILYNKAVTSQFNRDSYYFVGCMVLFAAISYSISIPKFKKYGFTTFNIVLRSADLMTCAIPPGLPAVLASSIAFTIRRMKQQNIFCI
jgi:cation-transporting P-type ATPase 13A2